MSTAFAYAIESNLPFSEYVRQTRKHIEDRRKGLHPELDEQEQDSIIDGNSPFILTPTDEHKNLETGKYRRGILLTHGLTDSAYSQRHLAEFFRQQGFLVYVLLLPGHGTRSADLIKVSWQDWVMAYDYGVQALAKQVDECCLGGNSMGAALALYYVLNKDRVLNEYQHKGVCRASALFLFSPALRISSKARHAWIYAALGRFIKTLGWHVQFPDSDPYKYESFPYHAASQIHKLIQAIDELRKSHEISLPVFIATSYDDTTVDSETTLDFFRQLPEQRKLMLLYSNRDVEVPEKVKLVHSHFPDQKILSFSHVSIVLPPSDENYGENGRYSFCNHYYQNDKEEYERCKQQLNDYLGEITEHNLKQGVVSRLTYNPLYDDMLKEMEGFIASLGF
ncbi:MAG: alpha/beta fold hydrolase [Gammaproteobacteria bacterium]|nr:alpha/beta fold hydrolase [Gammaproteobacteria bacterium]